jgi:hypothetical protein
MSETRLRSFDVGFEKAKSKDRSLVSLVSSYSRFLVDKKRDRTLPRRRPRKLNI